MLDILPPVRLTLAHVPTPLEPLARSPLFEGIELWAKRDDMTGVALTGNKVRKLELLCADALEKGCDTLVTCGAVTSNHARATAVAAARLGLACVLVLRGRDRRPSEGNLLLDRLCGAEPRFIQPSAWSDREQIMASVAEEIAGRGGRAYVIPEGGSSHVGTMGYALCVRELLEQEAELGIRIDSVVHACGSGGTTAGLSLGFAAAGRDDVDVVGIAVCNDQPYFDGVIRRLHGECAHAGFVSEGVAARASWRVLDGYKGLGYAKPGPDDLDLIRRVAREEGLFLDPVYTVKAMGGLLHEAGAGRIGGRGAAVFLHTGGIFGLFSFAAELDPA